MTTPHDTSVLNNTLKKLATPLVSLGIHLVVTLTALGFLFSWMYFGEAKIDIKLLPSLAQVEGLQKQLSEMNAKLEECHKNSQVVNLDPLNNHLNQLQNQIEALTKSQKITEEQLKKVSEINLVGPVADAKHTKLVQSAFVLKALMDRINHGQSYKSEILKLKALLIGEKSIEDSLRALEELSSFESKTLEMLISELESLKSQLDNDSKKNQPVFAAGSSTEFDSWYQWLFKSIKGLIKITRVEDDASSANNAQDKKILDAALLALHGKRLDSCIEILKPLSGSRVPLLETWMKNAEQTQRLRKNIELLKQNINSLLAINSETKISSDGEKQ